MAVPVLMPRQGQSVETCIIAAWKKQPGDAVAVGKVIALYGAKARDVSPKQATYCYLQIDGDVIVRHGHILLTVTPNELARIEVITRQHHRVAVYLWRDSKWWAFPDNTHAE